MIYELSPITDSNLTFASLKLIIETLEQGVKYGQSQQ